jgi:hypothetical protein
VRRLVEEIKTNECKALKSFLLLNWQTHSRFFFLDAFGYDVNFD